MRHDFLGDSYDAVKRLWQEIFAGWAPLYAEPTFLPKDLRRDFTRLTKIPVLLKDQHPHRYSILNDPDTGIRLSGKKNQRGGHTHISIAMIVKQLQSKNGPRCVVTFDQSFSYGRSKKQQIEGKLKNFRKKDIPAFYYVSHASFLFAFPDTKALRELRNLLERAGIPKRRLRGG